MSPRTLKQLVEDGRLERIPPDTQEGLALLEECHRHLVSAETIGEQDPNGAYSLLYDAARKAVTAHMLVSGFRATKHKIGAHSAVVDYAEAALGAAGYGDQIKGFDRMRRTRNRSEYGLPS